jgi:hypothetical protein
MNYIYDIEIKPVSGGRKQVTVKLDGKVIGKRTSARIYRFALVVTGNQVHSLQSVKDGIPYHRKMAEKYQAIVDDAPGARNNFIMFDDRGKVHRMEAQQWHRNWIADGEVAKWLENEKASLARCEAEVVRLSSGPQPEFSVPKIASWHQSRKNVPSIRSWQTFFDLVEIPVDEPEAVA